MFKKKQNKYILGVGCSFTDPNFTTRLALDYDFDFPKWPEILGEKIGVDVVNLGRSGGSNPWIIDTAIDHILENKPWMVVIGLTEAWRYHVYHTYNINPVVGAREAAYGPDPTEHDRDPFVKAFNPVSAFIVKDRIFEDFDRSDHSDGSRFRTQILDTYLRQIIRLQRICKRLNIKLIMTPLLWPMAAHPIAMIANELGRNYNHHEYQRKIADDFMRAEHFNKVDEWGLMGWPWLEELGGWFPTHWNCGWQNDDDGNGPLVIPNDGHPNALGHQHIAEKFYEYYVKHYSSD